MHHSRVELREATSLPPQGSALPAWMKFDQEKLKVTGVPPKPEEWSGTSGIRDPGVGSWSCIACPDRFLSLVIAYGPKPLWLIPDDLFRNTMQSQTTYQHPEVPQKVHSHVPPEMRSLLENYPHFTFASVGLELDNPPVLGSSFAFVWCFWPEHQELSLKVKGSLDWWEKTDADTGSR